MGADEHPKLCSIVRLRPCVLEIYVVLIINLLAQDERVLLYVVLETVRLERRNNNEKVRRRR